MDLCDIAYLDEAFDRKRAIEYSDIILAWNPLREFNNEEYSLMKRIKFMQLLSAGGDHLPAELLNMDFNIAGNVGAYSLPMAEHVMAMVLALDKGP